MNLDGCDDKIGSKMELYLVVAKKRGDVGVVAGELCSVDESRKEMKRKLMKWYQYVGIEEWIEDE